MPSAIGRVAERDPDLERYTGVYDTIWGQVAILPWEDGLAVLDLASRDPKEALSKLKPAGEHTFRRVRKDDEDIPGETFEFEVAEDGTVTRFMQHSNWFTKIR